MPTIFNQYHFAFILLICSALLLTAVTFVPLLSKAQQTAGLYYSALQPSTPTILVYNQRLEFEGEIPTTIRLESGVTLFFDKQVNDSLLAASAPWSLFIAEDFIKIKTSSKIRELPVSEISIEKEPLAIRPLHIKRLIDRLSKVVKWLGGALFTVCSLVLLTIVAVATAGVGLMIDAFRGGPNPFKFYLSLAALFLLLFILLYVIGFHILSLKFILFAYWISYLSAVYLLISRQQKQS